MKAECPKCGSSNAAYVKTKTELVLRCLCGFYKVLYSIYDENIVVQHAEPASKVQLPKTGTLLRATLMVLKSLDTANSRAVTERMVDLGIEVDVSTVSGYLMVLKARGLVLNTNNRRGSAGGSTWILSDVADDLLGG